MDNNSWIHHMSPQEIEDLYLQYKKDPSSVDEEWFKFFQGFDFASANYPIQKKQDSAAYVGKEFNVIELIQAYRQRGHYFTQTNPVRKRRTYTPDLSLSNFGLDESDLDTVFAAGNEVGLGSTSLRNILQLLQQTYCNQLGVEYMYIRLPEIVEWLQEKMESVRNNPVFNPEEQKQLLVQLSQSVFFEKFLQKRFPGQKRFSLEGSENFIPAIHHMLQYASDMGVKEVVFGMAHRGRLNMLANVMKKPINQMLAEFDGREYDEFHLLGDVKYHLGFVSKQKYGKANDVTLTLCPNPSHLEAVGPVVQGIVRAKAREYQNRYNSVIPVVVHGDASVSGQGVVYEQIQMSELPAHKVGGTIHIVINNQIGFTTDYLDGRSSIYCTDVAKVIQSPIFHVNGDNIEAIAYTMQLALEYRMKFNKDVFIDLLCYRRYGHNESDEPKYTQAQLYKAIESHENPLVIYSKVLIEKNIISQDSMVEMEQTYFSEMDDSLQNSKSLEKLHIKPFMYEQWKDIPRGDEDHIYSEVHTAVDVDVLVEIGRKINTLPKDIDVYSKLKRLLESRLNMLETDTIDWGFAEQLAFASLLNEGTHVRICGQDVERGTFSHRHAVVNHLDTTQKYLPLNHIRNGQAQFEIYNSLLSEYAVLGFEYGYALTNPHDLIIWEAQFGDFSNGAQIVIDQFISSAEEKWSVMNNLVLFLPHGYEGQGPEHSSARMERFLNLCANYNMDVVQCSTPANFFHVLRRHIKRPYRKPLVLFTPKSLLRHPLCVSQIDQFTETDFSLLIDDSSIDKNQVSHIVLCSGKVYYDLMEQREKKNNTSTAFVRIEQLYPFPFENVKKILQQYEHVQKFTWVQDEPANMGAWAFVSRWLRPMGFKLISRPLSTSPATGSYILHKQRQQKIFDKVFGDCECDKSHDECKMLCLGALPNEIQL
jgi:2-oxoglutarate dehydrogenase E1 component